MREYKDMTIEELEAENQRLMAEKEAIRQKQLELNRVLSEKMSLAELEHLVAPLDNTQRAALAQVLQPKGIPSQEKFGKS